MRKEYNIPTFEVVVFSLRDVIMRSDAENVGGGGSDVSDGGFGVDDGFGNGGFDVVSGGS